MVVLVWSPAQTLGSKVPFTMLVAVALVKAKRPQKDWDFASVLCMGGLCFPFAVAPLEWVRVVQPKPWGGV
jgi:hypothetical protein